MKKTKQLSVYLENRPGLLARACSVLGESGINILAMSIHDTVDQAVVRYLVDNPTKALLLLEHEEFYVIEQDVLMVEISNTPGELAAVARKLAQADINIDYAYYTATYRQPHGCLVLRTKDADGAMEALRGIEPVTEE